MNSIEEFHASAEEYVSLINSFAAKNQLEGVAVADHIGYTCSSNEVFEKLRGIFEFECSYLYQSIISQRRKAIIHLRTPLTTILGDLEYLELSDQEPDGSQKDGFDHVEVYPHTISYEELVAMLVHKGNEVTEVRKPHHSTHNISLRSDFKFKIEPEALMTKIQREEMAVL